MSRRKRSGNRPEFEIEITSTTYPGIGVAFKDGQELHARRAFPGQIILARHLKNKQGIGQLQVLDQVKKASWEVEPPCVHYEKCGGCMRQEVPYEMQLRYKEEEVLELFRDSGLEFNKYHGILGSPSQWHYRNKMEYTFGDEYKEGPMCLGMHVKNRRNSILTTDHCEIVPDDFNLLLKRTLDHFRGSGLDYYWPMGRRGTLRNLVLREGRRTGQLMAILVTTSDERVDARAWAEDLLTVETASQLTSIYHMTNDSFQDAVVPEKLELLHGQQFITEEICGLTFQITPTSFFQTSTEAAEKLFEQIVKLAGDVSEMDVFDLYCGTGTIGNILAKSAYSVTGVEIIEEAALIAQENARINGNQNAVFIAGDVRDVLRDLEKTPDLIVMDPPRAGIHPKALEYAMAFNAKEMIYVSCNPKSLANDLMKLQDTMSLEELILLDNYPNTNHVEAIVLMSRK